MLKNSKYLWEILLGLQILISGLFPILSALSLNNSYPLHAAGITSLITAITLLIIFTFKNQLLLFKTCMVWKDIFLSSIFMGVIFYSLVFVGISYTTAGNSAIFLLFGTFFTFIFFNLIIKTEPIVTKNIYGAILIIIGALVILLPKYSLSFNIGDLIIIFATAFLPLGNYYAKKVVMQTSPVFFMSVRSLISGIFILAIAYFIETPPSLNTILNSWGYLFINGAIVLGVSVVLWLEAIKRLPITKCQSFTVATPAVTLIFAYFILNEVPTAWQIAGFIPIVGGVYLLVNKK